MIFEKNPFTTAVSMPKSFHLTPYSPTFEIHQPTLITQLQFSSSSNLQVLANFISQFASRGSNVPKVSLSLDPSLNTFWTSTPTMPTWSPTSCGDALSSSWTITLNSSLNLDYFLNIIGLIFINNYLLIVYFTPTLHRLQLY